MPVADFKTYCAILDRARDARYALPAANVTKNDYDPRTYLGLAEAAMAARVKQAVTDLRGNGKIILK